jgi:hypothetical protein
MRIAIILCGALAREVMEIARRHGWDVSFHGIDARAHMRPERIAPLVERKLIELIPAVDRIIVAYGDCGSGGELDAVLARYNVPRLAGPHCYEWYAGAEFQALMDEQPGTFFLTDFLLRGFDGLVWKGLGLDRFPQLQPIYFANYERLVYLAQREDASLLERARAVSVRLGLPLEIRQAGYGALETRLVALMAEIAHPDHRPALPDSTMRNVTGDDKIAPHEHPLTH